LGYIKQKKYGAKTTPLRHSVLNIAVNDISKEKQEIIVLRFTRVVFGVSSSPFLLNATIAHHIGQYETVDPTFVERFLENIYCTLMTLALEERA
jgi:hypothetical protein